MREILAMKWIRAWPRVATVSAVVLVVFPAIPIWKYLFKQDRQIFTAAVWAKENTASTDIILFRINHRPDMVDYPYNPVPAYYSERPTIIWTKTIPNGIAHEALEHARYAIVTGPPPSTPDILAMVNRFRGRNAPRPESMEWLEQAGFRWLTKRTEFDVFRKE